ncbi:MAG: AAA family ATPase [Magnetococcales bacterium]|nr:AAA family ATPase [Magnetococcales bacterium]
MYLNHFKLQRHPFSLTPDTELFYGGGGRDEILEELQRAIQAGEGIIRVTGETGSGKTMLCRTLCQRLSKTVDVAILLNPNIPPEQVVASILREFRVSPGPSGDRWADQHLLLNHLVDLHRNGRNALVLVEEAQCMPMAALEELRLLSNFETSRTKLFQIVLFGQPELTRILANPSNRQLLERMSTTLHLVPLTLKETGHYLQSRLEATGDPDERVFTKGAVWFLHRASRGSFRRLNVLAHKALIAAFSDASQAVGVRHVRTAMVSNDLPPAVTHLWQRPVLLASTLAVMLVGGTALHSWGNTPRMLPKGFLTPEAPAGQSLDKNSSATPSFPQSATPVSDGAALHPETRISGQDSVAGQKSAAVIKESEKKAGEQKSGEVAQVNAKTGDKKSDLKSKAAADKNEPAIGPKTAKVADKTIGNTAQKSDKIADKSTGKPDKAAEKVADHKVGKIEQMPDNAANKAIGKSDQTSGTTADAREKKGDAIPDKVAGKNEAKSGQDRASGLKSGQDGARLLADQLELPTTDDIMLASVGGGERPPAGEKSSSPKDLRKTDTAQGKFLAADSSGKAPHNDAGTEPEWQPDPKQNYPYLKKEDPLADRIIAAHIWIETGDDEHFTIQLMMLSHDDGFATLEKDLAALQSQIGNKRLNVVRLRDDRLLIYLDEFSSHKEAEAFVARLPVGLKTNQPLVIPLKQARARVHRTARVSG